MAGGPGSGAGYGLRPVADDTVLRVCVVLVGAAAMAALAVVELLPGWLALVASVAIAGCSFLARLALTRPRLRPWRVGAWVAVAVITLWLVFAGPVADNPEHVLGALVAGFVAATAADQDGSRRAMLVNVALALSVLALAAGLAPGTALVLPVALGWAAAVLVLVRAQAGREASRAAAVLRPPLRVPGAGEVGSPVAGSPGRGAAGSGAAGTGAPGSAGPGSGGPGSAGPGSGGSGSAGPGSGGPGSATDRGRVAVRWGRGAASAVLASVLVSLMLFGLLQLATHGRPLGDAPDGPGSAGALGDRGSVGRSDARSVESYSGGAMDLRARGTLPTSPVMDVPIDSPGLWRSAALDTYSGSTWLGTDAADVLQLGTGTIMLPEDQTDPLGAGRARSDQIRREDPAALVVPAPGIATGLGVPDGYQAVRLSDGRLVVARLGVPGNLGLGLTVTVRSQARPNADDPSSAAALRARAGTRSGTGSGTRDGTGTGGDAAGGAPSGTAIGIGSEPADPRWTQLPPEVPPRVKALGRRLVSQAPTRYDAVLAVERYLRANATYRLDSPVPAPGHDAVDDFLFISHTGFCEQFASAETVLLRAAGVPARVAVGFSGGRPGPAGWRTVRGSDAHAWVEVWFPGQGWVSSDPTAGATVATGPSDPVGNWLRSVLHWRWLAPAGLLALLLFGTGGVALVRRRRAVARHGSDPAGAASGPGRVLAAFRRLEEALDQYGEPRPEHETLAELADRLTSGPWAVGATGSGAGSGATGTTEATGTTGGAGAAGATGAAGTTGATGAAGTTGAAGMPAPERPGPEPVELGPEPVELGPELVELGPEPVAAALQVLERLLYAADPPDAGELARAAEVLDELARRVLEPPEPLPAMVSLRA